MLGDDTRRRAQRGPVRGGDRGHAATPSAPTPLATIGVGYNDTPESRAALEAASELAAPTRAARAARSK